ncbi:MAG TPA: MFS transporter [Sphingomonadales bacterium]
MIRATVIALSALLLAAAFLFVGHGMQSTLVPLSADGAGYSRFVIGLLWSGYAGGLMTGALYCGRIIAAVGHIRAFAALMSCVAAATLLYAFAPTPAIWLVLRFIHGFMIAGVFMIIESWLNGRAINELRGLVLAIYASLSLIMISFGQLAINLLPVEDPRLYSLAGLAMLLAVVPVALTRSKAPPPIASVSVNLRRLWESSRVAVVGSLAAGLTTSAFWGLGPVFGSAAGLDPAAISLYLSVTVMGGAVGQWVLGRMSDLMDRRRVVAIAAFGAGLAGIGMALLADRSLGLLLLASFFFGAFTFCISSICVAMAGDRAEPHEFVEISGGLLFLFSSGSVLGSIIASMFMDFLGGWALYLFTAICHGTLVVAAIALSRIRPPVAAEDKREFHPVPTTSQEIYTIDPRGQ